MFHVCAHADENKDNVIISYLMNYCVVCYVFARKDLFILLVICSSFDTTGLLVPN